MAAQATAEMAVGRTKPGWYVKDGGRAVKEAVATVAGGGEDSDRNERRSASLHKTAQLLTTVAAIIC